VTGLTKLRFAHDLFMSRIKGRKVPLFLYWFVTERCNYKCSYCYGAFSRAGKPDLPTEIMLRMIDEMASAGVRRVNLLGGEPFLRDDLGLLLKNLSARKISTCILTNGSYLPGRVDDLYGVDEVGMSIEGGEETHDLIRGRGAFRQLIKAVEVCQRMGVTVVLTYTMVSQNIDEVSHVMEFAKHYGVSVTVNVAHGRLLGTRGLPVSRADNEACRRALMTIIDYQRRGYPVFRARRTLELMLKWKDYQNDTSDECPGSDFPKCHFGSYAASLSSDGVLTPCFLNSHGGTGKSVPESGFMAAWEHCRRMSHCSYCHVPCFLEYNAIFGLSLPILYNGFLKLVLLPRLTRAR
jgi:MoaA/NifB/PqqE/SkfB family radical SAM enzyme